MMLDATDYMLINDWQRDFPLVSRPFATVSARAGIDEADAIARYRRLHASGALSRIGAVFRPNTVGASTLAAMAVAPERLDGIAARVSAEPGVNHNYEREHHWNLWFVATAPDRDELEANLRHIEQDTGERVLRLPLLEEFHIDLGFNLDDHSVPRGRTVPVAPLRLSSFERSLVAALERGIGFDPAPYAALAASLDVDEGTVIDALARWLDGGAIRRFGTVVRHRAFGYAANAMAVWDVPDAAASGHGACAASEPDVTLCYRRARSLPDWRYNLFCMVHGRERDDVRARVQALAARCGLDDYPHAILFSRRCYTQRGARYARATHG